MGSKSKPRGSMFEFFVRPIFGQGGTKEESTINKNNNPAKKQTNAKMNNWKIKTTYFLEMRSCFYKKWRARRLHVYYCFMKKSEKKNRNKSRKGTNLYPENDVLKKPSRYQRHNSYYALRKSRVAARTLPFGIFLSKVLRKG